MEGYLMELIGEAFIVKKGASGLIIKTTKHKNLRARPGRLFGRLFGRCVGICMTRIIVRTPTPGEPDEETIDHVECDKGSCNCNCVSAYEDYSDGTAEYWCECKK
jgi:hypothetical protein